MIGTGRFAASVAARIGTSPDVTLAGVLSRDAGRAAALAGRHGARGFTDLAEMTPHVDAAYVCGATGRHVADAIACVRAGLPTLCEKPMGTEAGGVARALDAARTAGVLLVEAYWVCHLPAWQAVRARLAAGAIGRPLALRADLSRDMPRAAYPRVWGPDDGALRDLGVYPVCLAAWLLGPARLTAAEVAWRDGVDAAARLVLAHERGAVSTLTLGFLGDGPLDAEVTGEDGALRLGPPILGSEAFTDADGTHARPVGADRYHPQFAHFAGLVRAGATESPIVPHALSRNVAEVVEAARAWRA